MVGRITYKIEGNETRKHLDIYFQMLSKFCLKNQEINMIVEDCNILRWKNLYKREKMWYFKFKLKVFLKSTENLKFNISSLSFIYEF